MFGITRNVWIPNSLAAGQATMSITKYRFLYCSPQNLPNDGENNDSDSNSDGNIKGVDDEDDGAIKMIMTK